MAAAALAMGVSVVGSVVMSAERADALTCVESMRVVADSEHFFAGHAVDSAGKKILIEVSQVRPGDDVPRRVWVDFDLAGWMPWGEPGPGHGVPENFHDDELWYLAANADWGVNACTVWTKSVWAGKELSTMTASLVPWQDGPSSSTGAASGLPGGAVPASELPPRHATSTLAMSAVGGVALGGLVLGAALTRRRRRA